MLLYGNSYLADLVDAKIYNISTMREGYINLQILIPPHNIGLTNGREFDINYMNYIFNNNNVFVEFFRIIQDLYTGKNVYLMFGDDDWSENLCQSLLKIIQQRYGYNAYYITSMDDYLYAINKDYTDFNKQYGLYNLDNDKNRYNYIITSNKINYSPQQQEIIEQIYS